MTDLIDVHRQYLGPPLDLAVYRSRNQDLEHLSDESLSDHFHHHGFREPRSFAIVGSTAARLSMKYLRGRGIEIGAGSAPTPLFGDASCVYADVAAETPFDDGVHSPVDRIIFDINAPHDLGREFDFAIASHVLEHVDSLGRGLRSISRMTRSGGMAYIALPNVERDADRLWMPRHSRLHHWIEIKIPNLYRLRHEREWCAAFASGRIKPDAHTSRYPNALVESIRRGRLLPQYRYIHHRHSYNFHDWLTVLDFVRAWVAPELTLVDACSGEERSDCHFVFVKR